MTTAEKTLQLISKVAQKKVSNSEELLSTGLIDSIGVMDLVIAIKQEFQVEIPFEEIVNIMSNTATIIEYVENHRK